MTPGLYLDTPKDVYLADPCIQPSLSSSIAKILIGESPSKAWAAHPRGLNQRGEPTAALERGSALDSLLLGGDTQLVVVPEMLKNAKGAFVPTNDKLLLAEAKAWAESQRQAGRQVIKTSELAEAKKAAAAITEKLAARGIVLNGVSQLTGIWLDGDVWCRMRLDHWQRDIATIWDLKIVECAHPDAVRRAIERYSYDIQHACYVRGMETLDPELVGRIRMNFIFAEPFPPYEVLIVHPAGTLRSTGEAKWTQAVATWGECLKSGIWPGYHDGIYEMEASPWEMSKALVGGSSGITF